VSSFSSWLTRVSSFSSWLTRVSSFSSWLTKVSSFSSWLTSSLFNPHLLSLLWHIITKRFQWSEIGLQKLFLVKKYISIHLQMNTAYSSEKKHSEFKPRFLGGLSCSILIIFLCCVCFLSIVLSVHLRFTTSDYLFGIFRFF
jgi:hypothetical protein